MCVHGRVCIYVNVSTCVFGTCVCTCIQVCILRVVYKRVCCVYMCVRVYMCICICVQTCGVCVYGVWCVWCIVCVCTCFTCVHVCVYVYMWVYVECRVIFCSPRGQGVRTRPSTLGSQTETTGDPTPWNQAGDTGARKPRPTTWAPVLGLPFSLHTPTTTEGLSDRRHDRTDLHQPTTALEGGASVQD